MGSLAVTILASCIAVPLGIMTAAYLAEIAASRTRRIVKPFVELLAALPSVVIGFFGMVIVAPFLPGLVRSGYRAQPVERRAHAGVHERADHLFRG